MLLFIEVFLFFAGLWAVVSATLPALALLFRGPDHDLEGSGVRLLGLVLLLPLPLAMLGSLALGSLLGERAAGYALLYELVIIVFAGAIVLHFGRTVLQFRMETDSDGKVIESETGVEAMIRREAESSLLYALLGGLGVPAVVFCPLAFSRSRRALRMMEKNSVGDQHRNTANLARILSILVFLFWVALVVLVLIAAQ
jgi:hypothetical protein